MYVAVAFGREIKTRPGAILLLKCNLKICILFCVAVRKPTSTTSPPQNPQIVHPPHLYTNTAATVIHQAPPPTVPPPAYHAHNSETATYVNVVGPIPNRAPPPFYHHPPPMVRAPPPQQQPHPSSQGHVPYSPAFQHHHVRPVGIAMPRQGNNLNEGASYQRQSSIGKYYT